MALCGQGEKKFQCPSHLQLLCMDSQMDTPGQDQDINPARSQDSVKEAVYKLGSYHCDWSR